MNTKDFKPGDLVRPIPWDDSRVGVVFEVNQMKRATSHGFPSKYYTVMWSDGETETMWKSNLEMVTEARSFPTNCMPTEEKSNAN